MMKFKKIYVTGAAGMIGFNICQALLRDGHSIIGIDNLWRGTAVNIKRLTEFDTFQFRHADISSDSNWSEDIDDQSVIIHTADIVAGIGYVFANEWTIFQKNLLINTQIARIAHFRRPRQLVYLGTACSYPQSLQRDTQSSVLSEGVKFPADPESGYGWSKLIGDVEFHLALKNSPTRLTVLDLHNVYGWPCRYQDSTSQVIPALIFKAITSTDNTLSVWGDGQQGRAFLHVTDVVSAVRLAIGYDGRRTNFMIGPDHCTTIAEVAQRIKAHPRINIREIVFDPTKPTGDIGRFADATLAHNELGWRPNVDFENGLASLIDDVADDYMSNSI